MATEKLSIEVVAELSALKRQLSEAGNLSEGKAEQLVIGLEKRIKAAEKAAKDAAKASKAASSATAELKQGLASAGKLAASFGGQIGAMGSTVNGAASAVAELAGNAGLGGMAVAGGIATAAIAAVAYGTYEAVQAVDAFVLSAEPAITHLRQLGEAGGISPGAIAAIQAYKRETDGASDASEALHVETAGLAASLLGPMRTGLTGAESLFSRLTSAEGNARDKAVEAVTGYHSLGDALMGLAEAGPLGGLIEIGKQTGQIAQDARNAAADLDYLQGLAEAEDAHRAQSAARADAAIAAKKAADKAAAAQAIANAKAEQDARLGVLTGVHDLRDMAAGYASDTLTAQQQLVAAHDQEIASIDAKSDALQRQLLAVTQLSDAEKVHDAARIRSATEAAKAAADERLARDQQAAADAAATRRAIDESNAAFYAELQQRTDALQAAAEAGAAILKNREDALTTTQIVADSVADAAGNLASLAKEGTVASKALLITQKAAGEASAIIAYEVAKAQALAQLGPVAGGIAVAAITAAEAASIATIAAQSYGIAKAPKSADSGGAPRVHALGGSLVPPDHVAMDYYNPSAEAVTNSRGTRVLGGQDGVDAVNAGEDPRPHVLEQRYGAVFERALVDKVRRPGPLRDLVSSIGGNRGHVAGH